jgi:hypothetical protein
MAFIRSEIYLVLLSTFKLLVSSSRANVVSGKHYGRLLAHPVQQISLATPPGWSTRRQSLRAQAARPPCPDRRHAEATRGRPATPPANHRRSRRPAGRTVSLAVHTRRAPGPGEHSEPCCPTHRNSGESAARCGRDGKHAAERTRDTCEEMSREGYESQRDSAAPRCHKCRQSENQAAMIGCARTDMRRVPLRGMRPRNRVGTRRLRRRARRGDGFQAAAAPRRRPAHSATAVSIERSVIPRRTEPAGSRSIKVT